jgi:hypothetical protein
MKNRYEELMYKSEKCYQNAQKCETDWGYFFWSGVADKRKEIAYSLNVDEL